MKAEIVKILKSLANASNLRGNRGEYIVKEEVDQATSSLTSLIIKWLEGKRKDVSGQFQLNALYTLPLKDGDMIHKEYINYDQRIGRNQLITELVEELK